MRLVNDDWYKFMGFPGFDNDYSVHVVTGKEEGMTIGSVPSNWCVMDARYVR